MKFTNYIQELKEDVKKFEIFWNENMYKHPDKFPKDMEPGEWDEQFRCWQSSSKKD